MAKISTYAIDSTPSLSDKVIGTDVGDSNITKNYTLGDIHGLITSNLTNLSIPIWDDANTEFVDSAFAQDKFSSPKYITFSTLLYQQNLGGSTYLGDNAGAEDNFDGEGSGNFNVGIGTTVFDQTHTLQLGSPGTGKTDLLVNNLSRFKSTADFEGSESKI